MLKIENVFIYGFEAAIRGMRNPMNSWDRSDSVGEKVGKNDLELMMKLHKAGSEHSKYKRMINVTFDILAPIFWYKECDTYRIGVVRNSCSTMHKITSKPIELSDFSFEDYDLDDEGISVKDCFVNVVSDCEMFRQKYLDTKDKRYWRSLIQLLPESYNQRSTMQMNYETLTNIYRQRKSHKLSEWHDFCGWIETLPYNGLITT